MATGIRPTGLFDGVDTLLKGVNNRYEKTVLLFYKYKPYKGTTTDDPEAKCIGTKLPYEPSP